MPVKIFFCYAHEDEALLNKLKSHLRPLQRQGLIDVWHDRDIRAGTEWEKEISKQLNEADIILLLISPSFMDSDYCYSVEMKRALERHDKGEARVIPIILEYVYWQVEPLKKLQALPTDAKPIVSAFWHSQNEALFEVVDRIRTVVVELNTKVDVQLRMASTSPGEVAPTVSIPSPASNQLSSHRVLLSKVPTTARPKSMPRVGTLLSKYIHPDMISAAAWSPNGKYIASADRDNKKVQLWDAATGRLTTTYNGHSQAAHDVAWSSNGQWIASASYDHTVQIWNPATGKHESTYAGHFNAVIRALWSPDDRLIASLALDVSVHVWDVSTGIAIFTHRDYHNSQFPPYPLASWSPDGKYIVCGITDKLQVYDAASGQPIVNYNGHQTKTMIYDVVWSPNGRWIASSGGDCEVHVWNAATGEQIFMLDGQNVTWSPDGAYIATWQGAQDTRQVQVWDAQTGKPILSYRGHHGIVNTVVCPPHGTRIASASNDGTVQVWDTTTGGFVFTYRGHTGSVNRILWSPEGTRIASVGGWKVGELPDGHEDIGNVIARDNSIQVWVAN